jgi:hypothetical protein
VRNEQKNYELMEHACHEGEQNFKLIQFAKPNADKK